MINLYAFFINVEYFMTKKRNLECLKEKSKNAGRISPIRDR